MRPTSKLLSLPASILFLIAAHTTTAFRDDRLPDTLPDNARGVDESADQRDVEAGNEQIPLGSSPVGVMKMSDDPGQKFYLDYWRYEEEQQQLNSSDVAPTPALRIRDEVEEAMLLANASVSISYRAPFSLHTEDYFGYHGFEARGRIPRRDAAAAVLVQLQKRQFECPTGTSACTSIGYPNSCCTTNETCFQIQDTGLGPVGCCPDGATCGGTISGCNSPNTPCTESSSADYQGGGCCIPNYVCAGVGCVPASSTSSTSSTSSAESSAPSTTSTTSTSTTNSVSTSSEISTNTVTSTASGIAPARPTGSTVTTTAATSSTESNCPTGFYACSAYYAGGCCRTGRDCDTTDCPAVSSTTIISSGVTVVVPVGSAATVATPSGNCASGWSSCAASLGGNCCLSGWQCGTASCTSISSTATDVAQKDSPSTGVRSIRCNVGLLIGGLMIVLVWI